MGAYRIEELRETYGLDPNDSSHDTEATEGCMYDQEDQIYFLDQKLFNAWLAKKRPQQ